MRVVQALLILALAPLLACDDAEDVPETDPAPQAIAAGLADDQFEVGFVDIDNSDVVGDATLAAAGELTRVSVELRGAAGAGVHQGWVYEGTCQDLREPVFELHPVATDAQGVGVSSTTVPILLRDLMDGRHAIVYHEADGQPGEPVSCAMIYKPE